MILGEISLKYKKGVNPMVNEEAFSVSEDKCSFNLKNNSRKENMAMKILKLLSVGLFLTAALLLSSCGHVHDIVIDPEVTLTCAATGKIEGVQRSSCGEDIDFSYTGYYGYYNGTTLIKRYY